MACLNYHPLLKSESSCFELERLVLHLFRYRILHTPIPDLDCRLCQSRIRVCGKGDPLTGCVLNVKNTPFLLYLGVVACWRRPNLWIDFNSVLAVDGWHTGDRRPIGYLQRSDPLGGTG
jgi:hypothetical protein